MSAAYVASAGARRQKIGLSSDPFRRVAALSGASGYPLTLVAQHEVTDAALVERMAHWLLRDSHIHGEWFGVDVATAEATIVQASQLIKEGQKVPRRPSNPCSGRGGRPPLGNKPTQIRLPEELKARAVALVGTYGLAKFIREAMEAELDRRERKRRDGERG